MNTVYVFSSQAAADSFSVALLEDYEVNTGAPTLNSALGAYQVSVSAQAVDRRTTALAHEYGCVDILETYG